ncbi:MAG: WD40 repeat domain-containing protein [Acidobacteriota bacterium]|nr:WD40 repeat domain-containing protein [Acidobacteriota bacterium]
MLCAVSLSAPAAAPSCYAQPPAADRLAKAFVRQPNHTSRAYSVAFRPDGETLASGSWDGTIKLWDVASGRELRTLAGHGWGIYKIAFSPEGKQLASASRDGTVKVWDAATGANTRTLAAGPLAVKAVAWSPDGRLLASGGNNGVVKLWDAASGRELRAMRHAWRGGEGVVVSLVFSPDGKTLAAKNWDGTLSLWEAGTGREARVLPISVDGSTSSIAFTPDGRHIAAADEMKIKFWEVASGKLVRTVDDPPVEGLTRQFVSLAFSPDGRSMATGEARVEEAKGQYYGVVKLWDAGAGRVLREAAAHAREPDEVRYSPDGRLLATGGADGGVKLWDSALKEVKTLSVSPLAAKGLTATSFDTPDPERVLPNTPAGLRLLEWLGSFNTGNVYLMGGFAKDRFARPALARKSADERALEDFKLYREVGELELGGVERATDNEITVHAKSSRTGEWRSIRLQLEAAEPRGVILVETRRIPAPPKPSARGQVRAGSRPLLLDAADEAGEAGVAAEGVEARVGL